MKNFEYYNPVKVFFGKGQLNKLNGLIPKENKVLIIYGGGSIHKNGVYSQVKESLNGYEVFEFSGIEPNPRYETCMKAVDLIKDKGVNFLLAVGGGSVIDATKFIAAASLYENGDPWDILAKGGKVEKSLPLGVVLTLPATGSEMNMGSVVTRNSTNEKFAFMSVHSYPQFSFLLPDAASTLPKRQVANGIVDAYIHVIEQYLTIPNGAPLQDRFAEAILISLMEVAPKVYENPADYEAMSNLMWCATMALNGLIGMSQVQDWGIHMIGHELTALHEIDHARTLAIVLPGYWKVFRTEKKAKLLQYGERVLGITEGTEEERINAAIKKTEKFFNSLDIKTRLADYDLNNDTVLEISDRFLKRGWLKFGDRGLLNPDKVKETLTFQLK